MKAQLTEYIRKTINVTEAELSIILSYFKPLEVEKNELLLVYGQTSQRTFFVGNGCLRIFFITEEGHEATRYLAFENNFATAISSFISNEPSSEFIQASEPTTLLYISHEDFYHLLEIIPLWEKFYRNYLEKAYIHNTNRLMSFLTLDATERYKQLLEIQPNIVQRLPKKIVATYLNISQETLSRLKSKC
ncbi:Crp/Fnr family transcriptional regulator [Bernardetia sp. MNP-M8]|uniref:Crp/Fnr family transcriptional regulator n=1 Tax=Bernardetia sp. MNP-M8 TaxID=3127470 RepID=UPI0030D1373F